MRDRPGERQPLLHASRQVKRTGRAGVEVEPERLRAEPERHVGHAIAQLVAENALLPGVPGERSRGGPGQPLGGIIEREQPASKQIETEHAVDVELGLGNGDHLVKRRAPEIQRLHADDVPGLPVPQSGRADGRGHRAFQRDDVPPGVEQKAIGALAVEGDLHQREILAPHQRHVDGGGTKLGGRGPFAHLSQKPGRHPVRTAGDRPAEGTGKDEEEESAEARRQE